MPQERRVVSSDSVPKPSFEVRRRHYGERYWLVRHNDVYELDPMTDTIWVGCLERRTIEQIVRRVAEQTGTPAAVALEATIRALRELEHLGFVELEEAQD